MSVRERRAEIIHILMGRRKTTMTHLAKELGVSVSTIQRDILSLTVDEYYPIDTKQGNGGGVILRDFRHPHKGILSREQIDVLTHLAQTQDEYTAEVLNGILQAYS